LDNTMRQIARRVGKMSVMKPGLPVAAIAYAAGKVLGHMPLSQFEIASACEVTDVALRYTYKRYCKNHVSTIIKNQE
jgi:transcription initiation factor TFIIIB Brf1 subunit/transcription initiation factor TFIIB